MSCLKTSDLMEVAVFVEHIRGAGYVLDFSDGSFRHFFAAELDVDIDDPTYADMGTSKGKRLRRFLQKVDDETALRALNALWDYRGALLRQSAQEDPVRNSEARFQALLRRLGGSSEAARGPQEAPKKAFDPDQIVEFKREIVELNDLAPQARGYAFERFLKTLFDFYGLAAREAFRNRGEQIDGSFELSGETYLLEAKWQGALTGAEDLHAFHGKLDQKALWARGLFISYGGFTTEGLIAFGTAKRAICMDGLDIHDMLDRQIPLDAVLSKKVRRAAETGSPFVRVRDLF